MDVLFDLINYTDDTSFTLSLFDSLFPDDIYGYDGLAPYDAYSYDGLAPYDIYGYSGLAPYDVYGYDALSSFDIYGYNGSVPYDVYGYSNNSIVGSVSDDHITGSAGNDVIYGDGGFDVITGEAGNDTLIASDDGGFLGGGSGDDILYAGLGKTFMQGDAGRDLFVLSAAATVFDPSQAHVLIDFHNNIFDLGNTGDTLVISNTMPGEFVNLLSGSDFNFIISGANTLVTVNDTVITLGSNGSFLGVVVGQTPDQVASSLTIS